MEVQEFVKSLEKCKKDSADNSDGLYKLSSLIDDKLYELNTLLAISEQNVDRARCEMQQGNEQGHTEQEIENYTKEKERLTEELSVMENIRSEVTQLLLTNRAYDKNVCFTNIRYLMRKNNVKLGDIERSSGLRVGYMSRLEKEGNTTEPSVVFLVTAARMLHVTVDELLFDKMEDSTEEMEYLNDFFKSLYEDTKQGKVRWTKELDSVFGRIHVFDEAIVHPLLDYDPIHLDTDGTPLFRRFVSAYYPEKYVSVTGDVYYAEIPDSKSRIFIIPCQIDDSEKKESAHMEVYIVDDSCNTVSAVYNSNVGSESATHTLSRLYDAAGEDTRQVHIDAEAKSIIDNYLNLRKFNGR